MSTITPSEVLNSINNNSCSSNLLKRSYTEIQDEKKNGEEEPVNKCQRLCRVDSDNEEEEEDEEEEEEKDDTYGYIPSSPDFEATGIIYGCYSPQYGSEAEAEVETEEEKDDTYGYIPSSPDLEATGIIYGCYSPQYGSEAEEKDDTYGYIPCSPDYDTLPCTSSPSQYKPDYSASKTYYPYSPQYVSQEEEEGEDVCPSSPGYDYQPTSPQYEPEDVTPYSPDYDYQPISPQYETIEGGGGGGGLYEKIKKKKPDDMEAPKPKFVREQLGRNSWLDTSLLPADLLADSDEFKEIWDLHPESAGMIMIMGKLTPVPRFQQSYLRDYKFSGVESKSVPLPEILQPYLRWANALGYGEFNQFLVNWYFDGNNYIGSHSDDEKQLLPASPIITITLCQPSEADKKGKTAKPTLRKFRIRDKDKNIVKDVETANGVVLVMGNMFQREFKHEIVKITGKKANEVGPRISITLRQFKPEKEVKHETSFFSECTRCQINTSMVDTQSKQFYCSPMCYLDTSNK